MNMKQLEKSWFPWPLASLMVVMMFLPMGKPLTSQSSDRNITLIRDYCSTYYQTEETYFFQNFNATFSSLRWQLLVNRLRYAVARTLVNGASVWGRAWCRGYVSTANCVACFDYAVAQLRVCGHVDGGHAFYNDCDLRYDTYDFYTNPYVDRSYVDRSGIYLCGNQSASQPTSFIQTVDGLLSDIKYATPKTSDFYVASIRQIRNGNGNVYGVAQCVENISHAICQDCINARYTSVTKCLPNTEGMSLDMACFARYSATPFFNINQTIDIRNILQGHSSNVTKFGGAIGGAGLFIFLVLWLMLQLWKKPKKTKEGEPDLDEAIKYNYKHLQSATNNFSEENLLGRGGFGKVFKADLDANNIVAVKKIEVGYTSKAKEEFENEVKLIGNIHHRNLLRLLGWSSEGSNLVLVLEYMSNGSLDGFLWGAKKGTLNWKQRYGIIFGIARGLHHLHNESHVKIIHRDIKSSNILLDHDFQPKIADFGLARFIPDDQSHLVSSRFAGTLGYTAPEYARHGILSDKVDTYSFGIVTLEIISGRRSTDMNFDRPSMDYLLEHVHLGIVARKRRGRTAPHFL